MTRLLYLARHGETVDDGDLSEAGRWQASLLGERLREVPFTAVHHSPLPRAAQTARLVADHLPGVPTRESELLGDYPPPVPDRSALPDAYRDFLDGFSAAELAEGDRLAAAALDRYARPGDDGAELVVTHNFLVAWFVRHALDAPDWRWMGLNQCNAGLTVIRYRADRPPALMMFNDMSHLPPDLRWTGYPPELRA